MKLQDVLKNMEQAAKDLGCSVQDLSISKLTGYVSERQLRKHGGLPLLKGAHFPDAEKELSSVERTKLQKSYVGKLESAVGKRAVLEEEILNVLSKLKPVTIKPYKQKKKESIQRELSLVLSDLHFGSDIDGDETGNVHFGKLEESRRFARVIKETIEYKPQYRNTTELNVLILGDIIENKLHDIQEAAPIAEQCARAIHLLTQGLAHLATNFPKVKVRFASGNHGRNTARHHGRAISQKWDSLETVVYYAVKTALKNAKNVTFDLPKTPYVVYEVFGKKVLATHGDSLIKVGYPGKAIQTGSLETQINKVNAALPDTDEYSVVVVGHVHVGSVTHLNNGVVMITNGALTPVNPFAVSIGIMESACGQYLFESVKGFPVGDCRYIRVTSKDDQDKSLDQLIEPWKSL